MKSSVQPVCLQRLTNSPRTGSGIVHQVRPSLEPAGSNQVTCARELPSGRVRGQVWQTFTGQMFQKARPLDPDRADLAIVNAVCNHVRRNIDQAKSGVKNAWVGYKG